MCLLHTTLLETFCGPDCQHRGTQVQLSSVGITTNYIQHIGGTWHVSVDSKFPTVDIRRWYEDSRAGLKPTRVEIALTYSNWAKLKKAIVEVENQIPAMLAVSPCWHDGQMDKMLYDECSPYRKLECVADIRAAESAEKLTIDTDSSDGDVDFIRHRMMLRTHLLFSSIE